MKNSDKQFLIYESDGGTIEVHIERDTVWLSQREIASVFGTEVPAISKHVGNILSEKELEAEATVSKMERVQQEGKRQVRRYVDVYNLDMIISIGYRVNSSRATRFRQWATARLKEHLVQGYTLNRQRFEANAKELEAAMVLLRKTAQSPALQVETSRGLVDIATSYAQTFLLLQRYDEGLLTEPRSEAGGVLPSLKEARYSLANLKAELIQRKEATALFAQEREEGLASLLGNLDQSVFGEAAYPSIESKAAHLLYFVVKNHPFSDGNKRSAAFLFVDFLNRNNRLLNDAGEPVINDVGLAALTLLVAESDPAQKETLIRLIMNMLAKESVEQ